jgi:hypothetical protein
MSGAQAGSWSLVVAALLVPAALQAQAGKDSISTSAVEDAGGAARTVETGYVNPAAADTGQVGMRADTALKQADARSGAAKHQRKERDSRKPHADTLKPEPYSSY